MIQRGKQKRTQDQNQLPKVSFGIQCQRRKSQCDKPLLLRTVAKIEKNLNEIFKTRNRKKCYHKEKL